MAGIESPFHGQSYGQQHHVNSCEESKRRYGKDHPLSYTQGNRILGACNAIICMLNMGYGSTRLIRLLVGEMDSAFEEQQVSKGKAKPSTGLQPQFSCANKNCNGDLNEKAKARIVRDPEFKTTICSECHFKRTRPENATFGNSVGRTEPQLRSGVGKNTSEPVVMQVSTDKRKQNSKVERTERRMVTVVRKGMTSGREAEQDRRSAAAVQNVKFSMTVNPEDSMTLSEYFESVVPCVDDSGQSEEEGVNAEGDSVGEGENEDASSDGCDRSSEWATSEGSASCTSPSNGDDDQCREVCRLD